jgi:hypothetical protein
MTCPGSDGRGSLDLRHRTANATANNPRPTLALRAAAPGRSSRVTPGVGRSPKAMRDCQEEVISYDTTK